jgi:hypothetical protein
MLNSLLPYDSDQQNGASVKLFDKSLLSYLA